MKYHDLILLFALIHSASAFAEYQLDAGDLIKIVVYDEPDLSLETRVDSVGVINYPFIGQLTLRGKSVDEVKQQLVKGLKGDYLINPEVTVTIVDYRQFFVIGRVKKPGGFAYQPGLTVQKSISLAGGFDARANKEDIFLTRGKEGQSKKTTLDTIIYPGDVISVERSFF
ncbi:MAG: protein involved in polysaccharide export with SLBB domain [Gammaproteobacteria bacterium]|jgi:protein involved in polysaccharide export with SLBB domain